MNATDEFRRLQRLLLQHVGVRAESRFLDLPAVSGRVHVLVSGDGPPVVMVPGFGDPAAMWAPLMGQLGGFSLYAVDRPFWPNWFSPAHDLHDQKHGRGVSGAGP
jgi:hypothetical protein